MTDLEYIEKICGKCGNCPTEGKCKLEYIVSATTIKGHCTTTKCKNHKEGE